MSNLLTRKFFIPKVLEYFMCLLLLLFILWIFFPLPSHSKTKAKIAATRVQIKILASNLEEFSKLNNRLPIGGNATVISTLETTFTNTFYSAIQGRTNSAGELLDYWQEPLQIEIVNSTNFTIRSAGKDKIFGDADDIIFNSVSNNFVKP